MKEFITLIVYGKDVKAGNPIYIWLLRWQSIITILSMISRSEVHENAREGVSQAIVGPRRSVRLPVLLLLRVPKRQLQRSCSHSRSDKKFVEWEWNAYRPAGNKKLCT